MPRGGDWNEKHNKIHVLRVSNPANLLCNQLECVSSKIWGNRKILQCMRKSEYLTGTNDFVMCQSYCFYRLVNFDPVSYRKLTL